MSPTDSLPVHDATAPNLGSFDRVAGPQRGTNYPIYTDALLDWYQVKNIRSLRLISPRGQLPSDTNT